jgi:hypothetical protein
LQNAKLTRDKIIDEIDIEMSTQYALDYLGPHIRNLKQLAERLCKINNELPSEERSDYQLIPDAVELFLKEKYSQVIDKLKGFRREDQRHPGYGYLLLASLLRNQQYDEAKGWIQQVLQSTVGKFRQMLQNATAYAMLANYKKTGDIKQLNAAVSSFQSLSSDNRDFDAARVNLACAYSVAENYEQVDGVFLFFLKNSKGVDWITEEILKDMNRDSEKNFKNYIQHGLKIELPSNADWRGILENTLQSRLQNRI